VILLEPQARDSAPAMAAAAAWIDAQGTDGIAAVMASDHHIPDSMAFQEAVLHAAHAASGGKIVTLGVRPTEASSAYGYIRPAGAGLADVAEFQEKPDPATARAYVEGGYLWNSGNFIVSARGLLSELKRYAPGVEAAARAAVPDSAHVGGVVTLSNAFLEAPRISIDYAVMEKTDRASVLPVDFRWSDLGAWDAIAATGSGAAGIAVLDDAEGCLVRAAEGMVVVAAGVTNLAIIAESDAVLVCDLSRAQDVKRLVGRLKAEAPARMDFPVVRPEGLEEGAERFSRWLKLNALPIWSTLGVADDGSFEELLSLTGRKVGATRRARVQMRQVYVYCRAGSLGWDGQWKRTAHEGLAAFLATYSRDDGLYRTLVSSDGEVLDDTAMLYDQAFVLFALAAVHAAGLDADAEVRAVALRNKLVALWPATGGLRESGEIPFQSNPHMHLLEACLAWSDAGGDPAWREMANRIVALTLDHFIDSSGGFLREFFKDDWAPAQGALGRLVEPGHQFEWAWLLERFARMTGRADVSDAARRLYAAGVRGIDSRRQVAVDGLEDDFSVRSDRARLWPQTEWLKASLIFAEAAEGDERAGFLDAAAEALRAVWTYLEPSGLWRDKLLRDGGFVDEPASASSFYHIMTAFDQLASTGRVLQAGDTRNRLLA
ncbi:MAG: AGE family epimerase/isomerase, partial [Pseudomonadota bacterium]|nr:AGE family epimerase/isomerase [Pseudomonadota bacterium]